ncbi:WASH complex, F-actin capping protein, beta subunit [Ophiocordyceps sinensis CO18]|uniref:F-actin-capping protein subunit beta n=1 Tax=Ophiocordyceps sinensis (strain Co18 / CGMCC 3.14243) TaxID=911162 RepID=T5AH32_OPHSC|nr:WASH complex, F-actin capping protein, beta subunit [Ophiocordyceps sinensis CO18]
MAAVAADPFDSALEAPPARRPQRPPPAARPQAHELAPQRHHLAGPGPDRGPALVGRPAADAAALQAHGARLPAGGVGSVYLWNLDDGFAGVVLLKKSATPGAPTEGVWDSIHVFEAIERGRTTHYKLTSTVILSLSTREGAIGDMDLSGNMTRQVEQDLPVESDDSHIANIGRLVEDMELKMRNLLQDVYFGKAKDVVGDLRSVGSLSEGAKDRETQRELIGSMKR